MKLTVFFQFLSISAILFFPASHLFAQTPQIRLDAARAAVQNEEYDKALSELAPLLEKDSKAEKDIVRSARNIAAAAHQRRGENHFRNARIEKSIEDFNAFLKYEPEAEPGHWQRGISYYYAGEYQKGVEQFELHRTVNPEDVENAVWHFLCAVRAPGGSVEKARENLIPIERDTRVPMKEVHDMFEGKATPDAVLKAGAQGGKNGQFYADLYVGLYYEALGEDEKAMNFVARAATNPSSQHYMGDVARVHLIVRNRESEAPEKNP